MPTNQDWMKMTKGGSRESEYSKTATEKKRKKKGTEDLSIGGAVRNVLKISTRAK